MQIDVASSKPQDVYQYLVGLVTPRPIAWVSTISLNGVVNLAPFSFFNVFGANPPIAIFSPTLKRDGTKKDTLHNVEATGEFVINISTAANAEVINSTSKELPPEESEMTWAKLTAIPSVSVKPPRVKESPAALECIVKQIIPCGTGPIAANLVIGEVKVIHVNDDVLDAQGVPDPRKLKTVARLGGAYWCQTSDLFELQRP